VTATIAAILLRTASSPDRSCHVGKPSGPSLQAIENQAVPETLLATAPQSIQAEFPRADEDKLSTRE